MVRIPFYKSRWFELKKDIENEFKKIENIKTEQSEGYTTALLWVKLKMKEKEMKE